MFYVLRVSRETFCDILCFALFCGETADVSGLSSHQHEHHVDVAWRNARNAACLSQRFRVDAFELLAFWFSYKKSYFCIYIHMRNIQ